MNLAGVGADGRHWSGAAGAADAEGTPLHPDTPFFIASVTKRFIITLVLQAHERGELHLDDPITTHLPSSVTDGLHVIGGREHTARITLRHLAGHTSGLAGALFEDPATVELLTERANTLRNAFPLRYGLGTTIFEVERLSAPGTRSVTSVGHSGSTGTWLSHCPELDLHLAGTIDQADGRALHFRLTVRLLPAWTP